jgi:hypothetical protein|tara:strand:+ start:504 stop:797 length:294 start_codon:yes stop_codon:yes gene_type:complete
MEIDKNKFKRLKRKVLRKFPKASTQRTSDGKFFVSDGTGNVLLDEYMIPPQKTVAAAWFWMAETMRVNQNIERTHPNRMDLKSFEAKFARLSKRNRR